MSVIAIIGSRRRDTVRDLELTEQMFLKVFQLGDVTVSGGCPEGGDRFAEIIAKKYGLTIIIHYPNWKKYGRGAAFVRNNLVAKDGEKMIACVAEDRMGGTEDTIRKFRKFHPKGKLYLV